MLKCRERREYRRVEVQLSARSSRDLDRGVTSYLEEYSPAEYGTHIRQIRREGRLHVARLTRKVA